MFYNETVAVGVFIIVVVKLRRLWRHFKMF